jgi:tetratricopeptide (TPR) repeat protein
MADLWEVLTTPNMLLTWGVAGVVLILIVLAYKFAPDPDDRIRAQALRQVVEAATGIRPARAKLVEWPIVAWIMGFSCFAAGILLNAASIGRRQEQSIAGWLLITTFLPLAIGLANVKTRAFLWIYRKLLQADYEGALARADLVIRWFQESPLFYFARGTVLLFAGRLAESEQSFRTSLEKAQMKAGAIQILALANLGHVLLDLGRFREAADAFEACTKVYPRYAAAHSGLAEVLLRQGKEPQRALLLIDNALKLKQDNPRARNVDRHSTAYMWADRALALAMLGRMDDAAAALVMADDAGDPAFLPGLAGAAWRCGLAFLQMNKVDVAIEQFRNATVIDPCGLYGRRSAAALQEQSVRF